ncbi:MAG: alpha/beta fold hydrolase [Myxococcota bacterium]|nr:alpha/beta fold hydrolase [Myxococcota bacterium]
MNEHSVETRKGIACTVREAGDGPALLYLHGAGGLYDEEPLLTGLAESFHVFAPEWPGYGEQETEEKIEDMLDFALHGWDVVDALGLESPHLVGHSMGGMIAAEMACLNPKGLGRLALICPAGLWIDEHPIPDLFAMLPFELAKVLFHDPKVGEQVLTQGLDFSDMNALQNFLVGNARRLGTAGKILFPIPNRQLAKRLYRQTADSLLVWGREDRFIPPVYAERWQELLPSSQLALVDEAGHMAPYEQPEAVLEAIRKFLGAS